MKTCTLNQDVYLRFSALSRLVDFSPTYLTPMREQERQVNKKRKLERERERDREREREREGGGRFYRRTDRQIDMKKRSA